MVVLPCRAVQTTPRFNGHTVATCTVCTRGLQECCYHAPAHPPPSLPPHLPRLRQPLLQVGYQGVIPAGVQPQVCHNSGCIALWRGQRAAEVPGEDIPEHPALPAHKHLELNELVRPRAAPVLERADGLLKLLADGAEGMWACVVVQGP
jgi:hypothetical protein